MTDSSYKLSIIIPTWNCAGDISKMLDSILSNTFQDWRCFIVDDQSIDDSVTVIQNYCNKDSRIKCVIRDRLPKGAQTCRNIGFELSKDAEYVIWFDADDVIAFYCLQQRVAYMDRHPELDFGVFLAKQYNHTLWDIDRKQALGWQHPIGDLRRFYRRTLPFGVWTNIYRRSSLVEFNHTWDEKILSLQDSDFNIQAIIKGMKYDYAVKECCKVDYFWHDNPKEATVTKKIISNAHIDSHLYFLNKQILSLSRLQKCELHKDIDALVFFFVNKFLGNSYFQLGLLKQQCIKERPWFRFRLWIYFTIRKGKSILFPETVKYMNYFNWVYWDKGQVILKQIINDSYPLQYPDFEEK